MVGTSNLWDHGITIRVNSLLVRTQGMDGLLGLAGDKRGVTGMIPENSLRHFFAPVYDSHDVTTTGCHSKGDQQEATV